MTDFVFWTVLADDCSKSEGTLRLMIHNFRNMNDTVRGPAKVVNNVPWYVDGVGVKGVEG